MKRRISALALAALLVLGLTACGGKKTDGTTIKVGATPAPHAAILEVAKEILAEQGYTLDIVEYDDYVTPNTSLEDGSLDANYFQHITYMNEFNAEHGTHLVSAAGTDRSAQRRHQRGPRPAAAGAGGAHQAQGGRRPVRHRERHCGEPPQL